MSEAKLTGPQIRLLMAAVLATTLGGTIMEWEERIGPVIHLPDALNPRGNWSFRPRGTEKQVAAIIKAVQLVATAYPCAYAATEISTH